MAAWHGLRSSIDAFASHPILSVTGEVLARTDGAVASTLWRTKVKWSGAGVGRGRGKRAGRRTGVRERRRWRAPVLAKES